MSSEYKAGPVWREARPLENLPRGAWWSVFNDATLNKLELRVFGNDAAKDGFAHAVLVARLDNLGKGASGAAVQNLQLMLGL